jgi:tetratricopeptide (TPR) repeat protein
MINAAEFAAYAGDDLENWSSIVGQRIMHSAWGYGTICTLKKDSAQNLTFHVEFDQPVNGSTSTRRLARAAFDGVRIKEVSLSDADERKLAHLREEYAQRKALAELRDKYEVGWYQDTSPSSRLHSILQRLEQAVHLSSEDIAWLTDRKLYAVAAKHYELINRLASAGSYWRRANQPRKALELTDNCPEDPMILTMRGGAYRDRKDLDRAEEAARRAIHLAPRDYHAYNLLGAICYQRGEPTNGDWCFAKAVELGSKPEATDRSIRSAVVDAPDAARRASAAHLYAKDSRRYEWAGQYLR